MNIIKSILGWFKGPDRILTGSVYTPYPDLPSEELANDPLGGARP